MKITHDEYMSLGYGMMYNQCIYMTEQELNVVNSAILSEIASNYPNRKKYLFLADDAECKRLFPKLELDRYRKDPVTGVVARRVCLQKPHVVYLSKFDEFKRKLKTSQETYIEVKKENSANGCGLFGGGPNSLY